MTQTMAGGAASAVMGAFRGLVARHRLCVAIPAVVASISSAPRAVDIAERIFGALLLAQ